MFGMLTAQFWWCAKRSSKLSQTLAIEEAFAFFLLGDERFGMKVH